MLIVARVPGILKELEPYGELATPLLQQRITQVEDGSPQKLNLSLGLLSTDAKQIEYLNQQLLIAGMGRLPARSLGAMRCKHVRSCA